MPTLFERLSALIPPATPVGPEVCLLPAAQFFLRIVERPDELPPKEWASFAELTLEGMSPFPLEQLAWGWHTRPDSRRMLVFAAHYERLAAKAPEGWEEAEQALPGLLAVLVPADGGAPRTVAVVVDGHLVAARSDGRDIFPAEIHAEPIAGNPEDPAAVAAARAALAARAPGLNLTDGTPVRRAGVATIARGGGCRIATDSPEGSAGPEQAIELSETQAWEADVRDASYKEQAKKRRRVLRLADIAVAAALVAATLLLLMQLTTFGYGLVNDSRDKRLTAQADTVSRLQAKQALGVKIEQFAQQELQPLVMLEVLNRYRPRSLHFTRTSTEGFNRLRIEGEATNAAAVNTFNDLLGAAPEVAEARVERAVVREGRAPFTLVVTFQPAAFIIPPEGEEDRDALAADNSEP